jgi:hypothetical protein
LVPLRIATTLLKKKLGFRHLMDVIPTDGSLARGSHGRLTGAKAQGPVFLSTDPDLTPSPEVHATDVKALVLRHVFDGD